MLRRLILIAILLSPMGAANAAELAGVVMPDTRVVNGLTLRLNGVGIRNYSFLGIRIYVAGLYLQQPSTSAEAILHSSGLKLLVIRFMRDVDVERSRNAWKEGLTNNCKSPCSLNPEDLERFLNKVPAVQKGDESQILFSPQGADVVFDGHPMGRITDAHFAQVMLESFIGAVPPTPQLKRALLGGSE